jgi:hypothetical protein
MLAAAAHLSCHQRSVPAAQGILLVSLLMLLFAAAAGVWWG